MLPHLNELPAQHRGTRRDRQAVRLLAPGPVRRRARRDEQNRVKNIYGQAPRPRPQRAACRRIAGGAADRRPPLDRGARCPSGERFRLRVRRQRTDARRGAASAGYDCRSAAAWARAACAARVCSKAGSTRAARSSSPRSRCATGYVLLCQARPLSRRRRAGCARTTRSISSRRRRADRVAQGAARRAGPDHVQATARSIDALQVAD